ncbi:hypothetical protein PHYBLDRAFT_176210 [Phycomyces blakesleeanus NRRL 1555(-)]|uniref:Uncharacterized protein n=1 Tax=Phycomyces blakesleeanus (strain ATCC 8743b / DSM 1359 / FGSC 10004 / NBRC 33097 / NRRL 1555) TaxID=763407 RepID=A0A162T0N6_PHYB8|nr:hypothetical protein PHYBLDRAFT_176210 [Phycomyces blakesleeanus NRRL 1555(-)]OAD65292.1 hypothetical protein PHYBLDRAFT_176210 [Phycomyces blakesleeanus NRRL 1555(-)]|eukprot:XP_018283332.1 hypothetical protein PHYBLDRAFT_176210 [Phycomyces blakesleeanus NRRL 1555(-)]
MPTLNDRQMVFRHLKEAILKKLIKRQLSLDTFLLNIVKDRPELVIYKIVLEKQEFHMNRDSFNYILNMIKGHQVFWSDPRKKQTEPMIQMMVALEWLGAYGNGASIGRIAQSMCISGKKNQFANILKGFSLPLCA